LLLACDARQSDAERVYATLLRKQLTDVCDKFKDNANAVVIEIMCHPGYSEQSGDSVDEFSSCQDREVEMSALCDSSLASFIASMS